LSPATSVLQKPDWFCTPMAMSTPGPRTDRERAETCSTSIPTVGQYCSTRRVRKAGAHREGAARAEVHRRREGGALPVPSVLTTTMSPVVLGRIDVCRW